MVKENWKVSALKKELGFSYLGSVAQSVKLRLSKANGTMTYCIYLAPSDMSGYNVCPYGEHCREHCLNGSGQNKCDELSKGVEGSKINRSRIKKTRLFYEDRETFMRLMIHEIKVKRERAKRMGYEFSIRINGTSDLSPCLFRDPQSGKNILELFNDVQFYDYSKRPSAIHEQKMFANYDVTFSYDGYNWEYCKKHLDNGGKAAVVFFGELPKYFNGYRVIDANGYDMRYLDPKGCVMGLHYHKTANDYKINEFGKRVFRTPNTPFIIMQGDPRCEY